MPVGARATAPGKVILFGEHSVVYGEPAVAVAIHLRTEVTIRESGDQHRVNGQPLSAYHHTYIREAIEALWKGGPPLDVQTDSRVPSASGLGSSAALSVATVGALLQLKGEFSPEACARAAYAAEAGAQKGRASPTDTSTVTHGQAVLVDREARANLLWEISRGERRWFLHHLDVPTLTLVVGYTGIRGRTSDEVAKVARFVKRTGFAREIIRDLGNTTRAAVKLLDSKDKPALGARMDEAHNLLRILGVSHPRLDELCDAARQHAFGAKLTGSGGGGSMIALTDEPDKCAKAIEKRGGHANVVQLNAAGVQPSSL
ncbi:MAG: mevalonate kinase [Candidatus Thermoplasmatota archaeon]